MSFSMKFETRELQKAMQLYALATKKDEVDIVNRAALNVVVQSYGTIKNTKKADPKEIEADMMTGDLAVKLASKKLAGTSGKRGKRGGLLKNQGWKNRVAKEARRIIGRRKSAAGYARSGWQKAGQDLGRKSGAAKKFGVTGRGSMASARRVVATVENFGQNIDEVPGAARALRRAISGAARDMRTYALNKMRKSARRYSAR